MKMYVARDATEELYLFAKTPSKGLAVWANRNCDCMHIDNNEFPTVKWEDDKPTEVELVLKETSTESCNMTQDKSIDWEQRRYEIAKSAINGILSNNNEINYACGKIKYEDGETHTIPKSIAKYAVACADALIEELKKKGEKQ